MGFFAFEIENFTRFYLLVNHSLSVSPPPLRPGTLHLFFKIIFFFSIFLIISWNLCSILGVLFQNLNYVCVDFPLPDLALSFSFFAHLSLFWPPDCHIFSLFFVVCNMAFISIMLFIFLKVWVATFQVLSNHMCLAATIMTAQFGKRTKGLEFCWLDSLILHSSPTPQCISKEMEGSETIWKPVW